MAAVLVLAGSSSCGAGGDEQQAEACPDVLQFQGRTYTGGLSERSPRSTGPAGSATLPGCNDTGPDTPKEHDATVQVEKIEGVPVTKAVLLGRVVYADPNSLSEEDFRAWYLPVTCDSATPTTVAGVWLAVKHAVREDALRPPYTVQLRVDDLPIYGDLARADLTVHVETAAATSLTQRDAQEALRERGRIGAQVHCAGGAFYADTLHALAH